MHIGLLFVTAGHVVVMIVVVSDALFTGLFIFFTAKHITNICQN